MKDETTKDIKEANVGDISYESTIGETSEVRPAE